MKSFSVLIILLISLGFYNCSSEELDQLEINDMMNSELSDNHLGNTLPTVPNDGD